MPKCPIIFKTPVNNLESIDSNWGKFTEIPNDINLLTSLRDLNLYHNKIKSISPNIGLCNNLNMLDLTCNKLTTIPTEICIIPNLQKLILKYNNISTIPTDIALLQNLLSLNLSHNKITIIPTYIGLLNNLLSLTLANNHITSIPSFMLQSKNLKELLLFDNKISVIPNDILNLFQQYHTLPYEHSNFTRMPLLYEFKTIVNYDLIKIPEETSLLCNLQVLELSFNDIDMLELDLNNHNNLQYLNLGNNPFDDNYVGGSKEERWNTIKYSNIPNQPQFNLQIYDKPGYDYIIGNIQRY